MELGDFTNLAASYHNRAGYSDVVLTVLGRYVGVLGNTAKQTLDVGAGTGKLTENLCQLGLQPVAVEPNDAMRVEGTKYTAHFGVEWRKGSAEQTGLPASFADWILMGSSFHWVKKDAGLPEFHRVLRPGGYFTAVWNPRNLEASALHSKIESIIYDLAPEIKRVSSGSSKNIGDVAADLVSSGHFKDCVFVEAEHEVAMTKERYLGAWRSVNDIQVQAGAQRFEKIMRAIEAEIANLNTITVPYKTRAWTVKRND